MTVKIVKPVRVAGADYSPGQTADFSPAVEAELINNGYAVKIPASAIQPVADFSRVGDISEVLPTEGEGEQFAIEDLVGIPIVILRASFDKGRSGRLTGKDIVTVDFVREDGVKGWFTTWSGVLIAQLKQLVELDALPRKCMVEEKQSSSGYRYYMLVSAKKK